MLTGALVVLVVLVFAGRQNPRQHEPVPTAKETTRTPVPDRPQAPASLVVAGQQVYREQACARCHSIAGQGSPRSLLDGIGKRLGEAEIRAWITPGTTATDFQARHADLELTPEQRDALVAYLRSLR